MNFAFKSFCSHNTHHYNDFFRAIRKSIAEDTLPQMIELIEAQKQIHDAQVAASELKSESNHGHEVEVDVKKIKIGE